MKKLFILLTICTGLHYGASAQHCSAATTGATPHSATGTPGLTPTSDSLAPAVNGVYLSDTIYFENYSTAGPGGAITINSLTIDSINNLPKGLCWETSSATNTFNSGQTGTIVVSGTTFDKAGQYKLVLVVEVATSAGHFGPENAEILTGPPLGSNPLRYYVRVDCPGAAVVPIDTVRETNIDSIFFAYPSQVGCTNAVHEIPSSLSNLSVYPNPMTSAANVSFSSDINGTYSVKMVSLLGAVVSSKEVTAIHGNNTVSIDRNGIAPGIYILSVGNANSTTTRKITIE